ncbi:hypothetical protein WR25_14862 isoform B [Diploscapter pachys]|uniref:MIF4G domain-containing protein n=2 Tax=Diploscapter pachys TaxID=2018661 RepID=A0A2A2KNH6_9BILA|nr:hypothetical protein WR25_14862 isoform B [Diploscapter pachys]
MDTVITKDNEENQTITTQDVDISAKSQNQTKSATTRPSNRPMMQLYRPPGLRSDSIATQNQQNSIQSIVNKDRAPKPQQNSTNPHKAAGQKPLDNQQNYHQNPKSRQNGNHNNGRPQRNGAMTNEENNNTKSSGGESGGSRASSRTSSQNTYESSVAKSGNTNQHHSFEDPRRLNRTESSLSSESQHSQKSHSSAGANSAKSSNFSSSTGGEVLPSFTVDRRAKQLTPKREVMKQKKGMGEKEVEDATVALRGLQINTCGAEIEMWISGGFSKEELAECVGGALCQHAIEGGGGRQVAKLCGLLKEAHSIAALCRGLISSMNQYWDCRDKLRVDHFRMWIAYLNFVPDVYANLGGGSSGELSNHVFQVFNYLLRAPILESLKIEELECLISALLSVGYELERECPDQLALLKDLVRYN